MQTPFLFKRYSLILVFLSLYFISFAQIARTRFPDNATVRTKDEWKAFWDEYAFGRYNNGGAQFTSKPITSVNGVLTIPFSKGDVGGAAFRDMGAIIYASEPHHTGRSMYVEEYVKFSKDFDWGKDGEQYRGGKFGMTFTVGKVGVGINPGRGNFQVTTMWRGGGKMDAYVYHEGQTNSSGRWPDKLIYSTIERDKWYKFGMQVTLNDPGKNNGSVEIWIDNVIAFERRNFRFSDDQEVTFKPSFATFFGGSGPGWSVRNDCEVFYKNISLWEKNPFGSDRAAQDEPTDIGGIMKPEIKVFPNPIRGGTFTVEMSKLETEDLQQLDILDLSGRRVHTQELSNLSQQITLNQKLSYGMYIVRVATAKGNLIRKVIIE